MPALYNENDPKVAAWLRELIAQGHLPSGDVDERSIIDLDHAHIPGTAHFFAGIGGWPYALALAGWPSARPVWTGSCPCQPFSCAGSRLGADDPRHLWPEWFRLIRECRPTAIFGEQVASAAGRRWLAGVRCDLESLGYAGGAAELCAASVGTPHIRQRLFWVADIERGRFTGPPAWRSAPHEERNVAAPQQAGQPVGLALVSGVQSPWPPGPSTVGSIPRMDDGVSALMVRGFGNAIVPHVAAEFVMAFMETAGITGQEKGPTDGN